MRTLLSLFFSALVSFSLGVAPPSLAPSAAIRLPVSPSVTESGMDATVGQNGWYTSNVTLHLARQTPDGRLVPDHDLVLTTPGEHDVPLPGATQIVRIDKAPPVVSWSLPDGAAVSGQVDLAVTAVDAVSHPARIEVSFDGGKTWRSEQVPLGVSWRDLPPSWTWSLAWDTRALPAGRATLLARASDVAGNQSLPQALVVSVEK